MYTSLRATSRTISQYLLGRFLADNGLSTLFGGGGTMQVSLQSPPQMIEANVQGLSVWMYRVLRDEDRLNAPDRRLRLDRSSPPPLPLRVHYLMTPVASDTTSAGRETEQVILGRLLQAFNDHPALRGTDLQDDFVGTDTVLNVRLEPLGLQEVYDIWDALEGSYRLSVSYEVSVVNIDPAVEPMPVSPVTAVLPEYAQIVGTVNKR
jgi:hypothetical protein